MLLGVLCLLLSGCLYVAAEIFVVVSVADFRWLVLVGTFLAISCGHLSKFSSRSSKYARTDVDWNTDAFMKPD